ncbi:MAG: PGF-pre-PGF domain-containing protein [Candidatus Methanoperedens sp.]|nr:PGF-pre-PGF domain-containing protein [Candidatus Methanoperedens sp.]
MKKSILFVLLLLLIPLAQAEPPVTSYWGTVTFDGITISNASITVVDSSGNTVASATSNLDKQYRVFVPWDDLYTGTDEGVLSGETLTFKINGTTATTRTIDPKGSSINLNLAASSSTGSSTGSTGGSSGGGGGGGGGGVSGENFSNIILKEKYDLAIKKDFITSYGFMGAGNPVMFVNITGNVSTGLINTAVEVLKDTSTFVKEPAPGKVYKNINIWVGTSGFATSKNIKEARISFKVENTWINSGGFKDSDIVLVKWDGKQWIPLETSSIKKDGTFTYFEAITTSFSPFAITARVKEEIVSPTPQISAEKTPVSQLSPTPVPTKRTPGFELLFVIVAMSTVFMLRKKNGL